MLLYNLQLRPVTVLLVGERESDCQIWQLPTTAVHEDSPGDHLNGECWSRGLNLDFASGSRRTGSLLCLSEIGGATPRTIPNEPRLFRSFVTREWLISVSFCLSCQYDSVSWATSILVKISEEQSTARRLTVENSPVAFSAIVCGRVFTCSVGIMEYSPRSLLLRPPMSALYRSGPSGDLNS